MKHALYGLRTVALLLMGLSLPILLFVKSEPAMNGVRQGLTLCTETLFPSLFPFLVLSELLVAGHIGQLLEKTFSRPVSALFGLSANGSAALLMGMLCGSPIATVTAVSLCEREELAEDELHRLLLFANNPGSGFLIGAVGGAMFGNTEAGVALFVMTWLSALLVGIALRALKGKLPIEAKAISASPKPMSVTDLTGSVSRGFSSLLQIFAFVIFFSCVAECLRAVLEMTASPPIAGVILGGMLEMTSGISCAVALLPPDIAFRLAVFFANFSGLSICLQLFSIAENHHPRFAPYMLAKLLQGGIALLLSELYLRLAKPIFITSASVMTFSENTVQRYHLIGVLLLSLLLTILLALWQKRHKAS